MFLPTHTQAVVPERARVVVAGQLVGEVVRDQSAHLRRARHARRGTEGGGASAAVCETFAWARKGGMGGGWRLEADGRDRDAFEVQHSARTRAAHAHGTHGMAHSESEPAPGCAGQAPSHALPLGRVRVARRGCPKHAANAPRASATGACLRASRCAGRCARACAKPCAPCFIARERRGGRNELCGDAPRVRWRRPSPPCTTAQSTGPR